MRLSEKVIIMLMMVTAVEIYGMLSVYQALSGLALNTGIGYLICFKSSNSQYQCAVTGVEKKCRHTETFS